MEKSKLFFNYFGKTNFIGLPFFLGGSSSNIAVTVEVGISIFLITLLVGISISLLGGDGMVLGSTARRSGDKTGVGASGAKEGGGGGAGGSLEEEAGSGGWGGGGGGAAVGGGSGSGGLKAISWKGISL